MTMKDWTVYNLPEVWEDFAGTRKGAILTIWDASRMLWFSRPETCADPILRKLLEKAPFETWGNAWFNAPCLYWPAKAGKPATINGSKVASVLLIDETLDAATPYPGSLEVRKLYPHSSLIAEPGGTSHADSLFGNACVDDQIADYLATGKLPTRKKGDGADTTCAPLPIPDPTAAGLSASVAGSSGSARAHLLPTAIH